MRGLALLLSLALVQGPLVRPTALPPTRDQLLALFGAYFETLRAQAGIPGLAAALVGDSDVLWEQPFGQQDLGASMATRGNLMSYLALCLQTLRGFWSREGDPVSRPKVLTPRRDWRAGPAATRWSSPGWRCSQPARSRTAC